jgi:hypothetical protein
MNRDDARAFILALNGIAPYVPPMHMQPLANNPVVKEIESIANAPDERPKPKAVDG